MNEAEYLTKNYRNQGKPRPITPSQISTVLLFIQNNSKFKNIAKTCLPPSMLSSSSIVHLQGCSAPQIFSKQQMLPFELSSCCSCLVFSYYFTQFLTLEMSEMSAIFVFSTKTSQPRPQVFLLNSALTCKKAAPRPQVFLLNSALTCKKAALLMSLVH